MNNFFIFLLNAQRVKDNKLIGVQREYSEDGKLLGETDLINGTGKVSVKYSNGKLEKEIFYKDGLKHGSAKQWHENGRLKVDATYKAGEIISKKCFDENGKSIDCPILWLF